MENQEIEYLGILSSFNIMLNELGNYVVLDDIKSVIEKLNSEDIRNGFYQHFLEIDTYYEVKRIIELLSNFSKNFIIACDNQNQCSQRILNDLNNIRLKEIETIEKWDELSLLFGLSSVRRLDSRIINSIILDIKNNNIEPLREKFNTFLIAELSNINSELESYDTNLDTLISDVIENKPIVNYSFSSNFDRDESYYINKIINLNLPEYDIYKGSINRFKKSEDFLKFYTHNNNIFKINRVREFELTEVVRKPLFYALKEYLKKGDSFKIKISPTYSGSESSKLEVGDYTLLSKISKTSKKYYFGKPITYSKIQITGPKYLYKISTKLNDGKNETISLSSYKDLDNNKIKIYKNKLLDPIKNAFIASYKISVFKTTFSSEEELTNILEVTENKDEANTRLIQANNINQMIDNVRTELIKSENREILESLLNNLTLNKLKFMDANFIKKKEYVFNKASEICENYRKYLNKNIEPHNLIKEIVIDANYILYIEKEQSLEILKTMELLKDAYKHIDKLRDKKIVFFLGNTGSGKSTTVSYLLGANLKQFINKVGDKVFEINNHTSNQENGLPKIGQSLGESETIYTQGYLIDKSKDIYLADCPGFNDTRGGHYELCSNLSIDQVIKNSGIICSLVIVLPIHSFLIDRGNPIIEFVDDLNDRFLDVFTKDFNKSSVFIIITKSNQVSNETAKKMKDGTRFYELRRECQEKIKKLSEEKEIDYQGIKSMKKRLDIWNIFYELNNKKQVEFIDVLNIGKKRKDLLAKITSFERPFDKSCYAPLMESSDMKQKFGKNIELSVHTWRKLIIHKFLIDLPEKRKEILSLKTEIEEKILALHNEKVNRINLISEKKILVEENLININNFENAKSNPNILTPELLNKLEKDADQSKNEMFEKMEIEIKHLEKDEKERFSEIDLYNNSIKELNRELQLFDTKKQDELKKINKLEEGEHREILYENREDPDEIMTLTYPKSSEIMENVFREDREYRDDEISKIEKIKCRDYRGKCSTRVTIERSYILVPKDPKERKYFKNIRLSGGSETIQGFTALLESYHYEPDYKSIIEVTGRKIRYMFSMIYDSGPLPWIKITWTIPNKSFNEAEIINKTTDISVIDTKLIEIKKKIERKKIDIEDCKDKNIKNNKEIFEKKKRLVEFKHALELENKKRSIEKFIAKIKDLVEYLESEIKILEDFTELDKSLNDKEKELKKKETEIEDLNKEFRNLSIIILTQLESAEMLRNLSNLIADKKNIDGTYVKSESTMKQSVISECMDYISSYDENIKKIEIECRRILNLDS